MQGDLYGFPYMKGKIMNEKEKFNYLIGWLWKLRYEELKSKFFKDKKKEK